MKKTYKSPMLEIERYELNSSIALNCDEIINLYIETCTDIMDMNISLFAIENPATPDAKCDCYVTAESGYWTS